jgi:hypothetical protein
MSHQVLTRAVAAMNANAARMIASAGGRLVAIYWFDLGVAMEGEYADPCLVCRLAGAS